MTQYPNATRNAQEFQHLPPFPKEYQAQEIEVFFGDSPIDSVYHYKHGEWIGFNCEHADKEPVLQILIDDQWAFIQVEERVLLDRVGAVQLAILPKPEELVARIAHMFGMEVAADV